MTIGYLAKLGRYEVTFALLVLEEFSFLITQRTKLSWRIESMHLITRASRMYFCVLPREFRSKHAEIA